MGGSHNNRTGYIVTPDGALTCSEHVLLVAVAEAFGNTFSVSTVHYTVAEDQASSLVRASQRMEGGCVGGVCGFPVNGRGQ